MVSVAAEDKMFWGAQTKEGTIFHTGFPCQPEK